MKRHSHCNSVKLFEGVLILLLDHFLEGADRLGAKNFDLEDARQIISEYQAVETEALRRGMQFRSRNWIGHDKSLTRNTTTIDAYQQSEVR